MDLPMRIGAAVGHDHTACMRAIEELIIRERERERDEKERVG
jgi:hypothetical protein